MRDEIHAASVTIACNWPDQDDLDVVGLEATTGISKVPLMESESNALIDLTGYFQPSVVG